jgi:hypothetical protein
VSALPYVGGGFSGSGRTRVVKPACGCGHCDVSDRLYDHIDRWFGLAERIVFRSTLFASFVYTAYRC